MAPRHLRFVCASANPDKVAEIEAILNTSAGQGTDLHVELLARPEWIGEVIEDADTLEGNARLKAVAVSLATGLPAIADDTGLEVPALGGAPGVHSARYAGPDATYADNRSRLLADLAGRPAADRRAVFATVAMVHWPDGRELVSRGECPGWITDLERGGRGFGYDPLFAPGDGTRTFSEMTEAEKNALSHRGRALRQLIEMLRSSL